MNLLGLEILYDLCTCLPKVQKEGREEFRQIIGLLYASESLAMWAKVVKKSAMM